VVAAVSDLDPEIYDWAGLIVRDLVNATRDPAEALLLDVGAGQGKYKHLLPEFTLDACEAWESYVDEWNLRFHYHKVFVCDYLDLIQSIAWRELRYDVVIMGDVLEHMRCIDAQLAIHLTLQRASEVIVVVPYLYPQHAEHGNEYQRHLQPDLTPEIMATRYPQLELIALETRQFTPFKGIYRGRTSL
jgi:hypothetical protein